MATVGELSKKFAPQLEQLQAIFPDWDEQDLVFALRDSKGNVEETVLAISEGRASQFTQATKKKPAKTAGSKGHGGRNADGWENADSFVGGGRGGRASGRGGRGGGGMARGMAAVRGARIGRAGARAGRGGYGNVNGGAKKNEGPSDAWPTSTATTADGWSSQVEQAEAASAHEDDGGWGEPAQPEPKAEEPVGLPEAVKRGAWGKELPKSMQASKQAAAPAPAAVAPPAAAPVAAAPAPAAPAAAAPAAPSAPAPPAPKPKMTWAQIAKPIEKPKPVPPPPAPKAPEPVPEPVPEPEEPVKVEEEEEVVEPEPEEEVKPEEPEPVVEETPEEPAAEPEPVEETPEVLPEPEEVKEPAAPAAQEESWAADPAIVGSAAPAAAPEPVTTYTGPPGFNTVASKAVGSQQPRTSSRGAHRFKNTGGEAVVLPAQASGVSSMEIQFGNLSFGGLNGDGVETPVQPEEPPAVQAPPAHTTSAPVPVPASAPAPAPAAPQQASPVPQQPSSWQQQAAPQQPAGFASQPQAQSYDSYGHQQQQQPQQPHQQEAQQQPPPQQQQQQGQQSQYGGYRQDGYYNPIGSQTQQSEQSQQQGQQQPQQGQQHQQPQQHSYDQFGGAGFSNQWPGQQQPQHNDYGHGRNFDSFSNTGYGRPPAEEPKQQQQQQAPAPAAPSQQPQQSLPHQNQYYSAMGNMGYYQHPSGPYNPYYQYGHTHNPGFQQYYPMASRGIYQPPAHQPPAPIPTNKPTPPTHSPYGAPNPYPSSGFEDQSYGLGRFGDSNKGSSNLQSGQNQQNPQPIGAGSLPQSGYQQQGLHSFLGGGMNTPTGAAGSQQPNRPQAGTPEDSFKGQGAGGQQSGAGAAGAGARGAQPQQPQTQQAFATYPYGGGYQNHEWTPYGQQQQHYGGSRNGGYTGGWQQ